MKKGFTIFELLLVVVILGLLMSAFSRFFLNKDRNRIYFDTCVARTYGKMNTFLGEAMTQKTVYHNLANKTPELYKMSFDDVNQKLNFEYELPDVGIWGDESIPFTGASLSDRENRCWESSYYTKITSNNLEVDLSPGLQQGLKSGDAEAFAINSDASLDSLITGEVLFSYCEGPYCLKKSKIIFDKRTLNANLKLCLINDIDNGDCVEWSK